MSSTAVETRDARGGPRVTPRTWVAGSVLSVPEARWAALSTLLFVLAALTQLAGAPPWVFWPGYLACYVAGGWEPALAGLQALRERSLDVDLLMIVAAIAAASIGQVLDGALLIIIFSTSGALEAVAARRTQDSVRALLTLAPQRATRLTPSASPDEERCETVVDTVDLAVGDTVLVRPGERIGADGSVVAGVSEVDQATITGEPLPVAKEAGAEVYAGTLNGAGSLTVLVERAAADSVVARIVEMVDAASQTKAQAQLLIERVEQRYSLGVVAATLLLLGVPLLAGSAFEPTLLRAMTFMIVASPCAVVLATMPPLLAVMANAGRHGVLLKSAVALEQLSQVDRVAFDKTGTLTLGTPRVADVVAVTLEADELLRVAAAAEQHSEHPVGRALVEEARDRGLRIAASTDFHARPGRGVSALVGGRRVEVGSPRLLDDVLPGPVHQAVVRLQGSGHTAVVVLVEGAAVGLVGLADRPREEAAAVVGQVSALTSRPPVLLSGDSDAAARHLAVAVGIEEIRADLLPEDKAAAVAGLQRDGDRLAFVGDGINDAPALATAHVGIAMGRVGSDLAMETSDAVLVRDELAALPRTLSLARRAERVVKANLLLAAVMIAGLVTWDVVGTLPLPLGVAGHEGSTIVVALNGLRLLRGRAWSDAV